MLNITTWSPPLFLTLAGYSPLQRLVLKHIGQWGMHQLEGFLSYGIRPPVLFQHGSWEVKTWQLNLLCPGWWYCAWIKYTCTGKIWIVTIVTMDNQPAGPKPRKLIDNSHKTTRTNQHNTTKNKHQNTINTNTSSINQWINEIKHKQQQHKTTPAWPATPTIANDQQSTTNKHQPTSTNAAGLSTTKDPRRIPDRVHVV